jgi:hypothetical protein
MYTVACSSITTDRGLKLQGDPISADDFNNKKSFELLVASKLAVKKAEKSGKAKKEK